MQYHRLAFICVLLAHILMTFKILENDNKITSAGFDQSESIRSGQLCSLIKIAIKQTTNFCHHRVSVCHFTIPNRTLLLDVQVIFQALQHYLMLYLIVMGPIEPIYKFGNRNLRAFQGKRSER